MHLDLFYLLARQTEAPLIGFLHKSHRGAFRLFWGPLVFSAITGGTQTQHWRGGGVGRSLILLAFLFTFKSGIRGVKP